MQDEAAHWEPDGLPKYSTVGVERVVPPAETLARVLPLMGRIGVTRLAEITHLDRNGMPNFLTVRPRDLGPGISYYNGKGPTRAQARASAIMEAIERYSGERCDLPVVLASHEALSRSHATVDPTELVVPRRSTYRPDVEVEWVRGYDLVARRPTYAPLNAVVCPYESAAAPRFLLGSTNGLASGNTLDEAVCHALCEINERDAQALCIAAGSLADAVDGLLAAAGIGRESPPDRSASRGRVLRHDGLPPRAARIVRRFRAAGLEVFLRDITGPTGIAAIEGTLAERRPDGTYLATWGLGSHPDARIAAVRALTEAAQSRVAVIQGGREDLPEALEQTGEVRDAAATFGRGPACTFADIPTREHATVSEDVAWILERFAAAGFAQVVAFDLTRPELGLPVVRVVVPGAEFWPLQRLHTGRCAIGPRCMRLVRGEVA